MPTINLTKENQEKFVKTIGYTKINFTVKKTGVISKVNAEFIPMSGVNLIEPFSEGKHSLEMGIYSELTFKCQDEITIHYELS